MRRRSGNKILAALNLPYESPLSGYRCTPSIGITLFNDRHQSIDELLRQADIAMYESKKFGRNTLHFFDPQMQRDDRCPHCHRIAVAACAEE